MLDDKFIDVLFDYMDDSRVGIFLWFIIWDLIGGVINEIKFSLIVYFYCDKVFMY